jgi:small GTP-binding protein
MAYNKIFIFGLDCAGKTVITNYLSKGVVDEKTKPTLSFLQQKVILPKLKLMVFDTPGQIRFRPMWAEHVKNTKVLIFVLETSDAKRYAEAKDELMTFIKRLYFENPWMIFLFHQMDKPAAKANLEKAKTFFEIEKIYPKVRILETNIQNIKTLDILREQINDLIIKTDLEDEAAEREKKSA